MKDTKWWEKPLRVIQYNLQVSDTPKMNPAKIAQELVDCCSNAVVINVGGIYAWYKSKVRFHHINEFLSKDVDLLQNIIEECHKKDIKVIARFDFSKTDDIVYLQKPKWFVKTKEGKTLIYGKERMGDWSLLLSTCINGGYRNEEVAVPVIEEVLKNYNIDGIFFNAPHPDECHCERCQKKYFEYYNEPLPDNSEMIKRDWNSRCLKDNIEKIYNAAKKIKEEVPIILYYYGYDINGKEEGDDLDVRYATADLICTEAQNILSRGTGNVPPIWKPYINMKIGNAVPGYPAPFGIIHSCPGMDWRHTGLPVSEYLFWMSQVMANGGQLWHSITGFNDTVTDKRIIDCVTQIDKMTKACEDEMFGAKSSAQVLLMWDGGTGNSGWVDGLVNMQYQFELMDIFHIDLERMKEFAVVVVPDRYELNDNIISILKEYVACGGNLLFEKRDPQSIDKLTDLIGISEDVTISDDLKASYLRFETEDKKLQNGLENVQFIALRDKVLYTDLKENAKCLVSMVPPFAPMDGVGAPPERASMPIDHTDIPMVILNPYGKGKVMTLTFGLSSLIMDYHLEDHFMLLRNCLDSLCEHKEFQVGKNLYGLLTSVYKKENKCLVHLINGIGQRPLIGSIPYHDLTFSLQLGECSKVVNVSAIIENEKLDWTQKDNIVTVRLDKLNLWNMICVEIN